MSNVISDLIIYVYENRHKIIKSKKEAIHSRLAFLSDKGGKTRVVAIVDILSQSLLKPVHDHLNSILKKFSSDGTFDQDYQRKRVQKWSEQDKFLASIDLSSCTDRFPSLLQTCILLMCNVLTPWQAIG